MIFHMPSWYMSQRWCSEIGKFADISKGLPNNLIYPHEGLNGVEFLIEQIKALTDFSEESFLYALQRSHMFRMKDKELCRQKLEAFYVDGKKITIKPSGVWHISRDRRKMIDD